MPKLKRVLTLPELVIYGVGSMVGAGIYSIIGAAALKAGDSLWLSFLLTSLAAGITILSYAELSSMFPKTGAEFQFLRQAFPRWPFFSFMAGFLIALNASATSATVAIAFAGYLNFFINTPKILTAWLLLFCCTLINLAGIRQSTWANIILVLVEVSGLLIIILVGFITGEPNKSFAPMTQINLQDLSNIISAAALIFFVYIGFEDVANLSEETRNPKQTIPRALILSIIITSIIYILVAIAFTGLSNEQILNSDSPLSSAITKTSKFLGNFVALAALFATASTALISLVSISRMLFGMAREGAMPHLLTYVSEKNQTPWVAALFLFLWACLFLPFQDIRIIASVSSTGVLLVFIGVQVAAMSLRFSRKDERRNFKIPLNIYNISVLPILGISIILGLLFTFKPIVYLIVGVTILIGSLLYFLLVRKTH